MVTRNKKQKKMFQIFVKVKGRKENGRKSEEKGIRKEDEKGDSKVVKDVTGWTVVTRNKRQRKMAQIFVKVNGSKGIPMEVSLTDDKVEDVMRRIQKDEDVVCDNAKERAEDKRKLNEFRSH